MMKNFSLDNFKESMNKKDVSSKKYYKWYTLFFMIMAVLVYSVFLYNGKTFIFCDTNQGGDGLVQHYNSFVYYGKYLREIIKTLLFEHRLEIPMWDMSIGYGQDIITTLSYYVIGDPFSFLSVFIPTKYTEIGYSLLIVLRLYCAGIAFSAYCRYRGHKSYVTIIGSLIYVFSYYGIQVAILHPYFTLPMIYLPLLLIGVEKMLTEKKTCFYTGMIALAAVSNFYFFYMLCILIFIYTSFRYVEIYGRIEIKQLLKWLGIFILYSVIGILMASILFIPSMLNILLTSRVSVENYVPIFYDLSYYLEMIPAFINGGSGRYYSTTGYTAIGLVSVILLILKCKEKKKYVFLSVAFAMLMLFLMIPFIGHIFNGAGYVTNRWIWALSMLVAYIVVIIIPEFRNVSIKHWKQLFIISALFCLIILISERLRSEKNILAALSFISVLGIVFYFSQKKRNELVVLGSMCLVMISIFINAYYCYSPTEGNYISKYTDVGTTYDLLVKDSPEYILKKVKDDSIYRFDTAAIATGDLKRNSAMLLDMNGVAYYFSTTNETITQFSREQYLNYQMEHTYDNLDRRSILEMLFGVRYIIIPEGYEQYLPYGYNKKVLNQNGYVAYACNTALPIGFTSDNYISNNEYEKLNVTEKQETLLNTIVIEGKSNLEKAEISYSGKYIPYKISSGNGVKYENGKFNVSKENATITIEFDQVSNSELYLIWDNLEFESINPYSFYTTEELNGMSKVEFNKLERAKKNWTEPTATFIRMQSENVSTTLVYRTWKDNYYCGNEDYIGNLGYMDRDRNMITLTFSKTGIYRFEELSVVSQPMEFIEKGIEKLTEDYLENLEVNVNELKGEIQLNSDKVLCVQIPYNLGWKAYVDGNEVEVYKADGAFMGIMLSEGKHTVVFKYSTPYLGISIALSLIGVLLYIIIVLKETSKRIEYIKDYKIRKCQ